MTDLDRVMNYLSQIIEKIKQFKFIPMEERIMCELLIETAIEILKG